LSSGAEARRGLGRGLEALLGDQPESALAQLPVGAIKANPRQPRRRRLDSDAVGLADSVRAQGLLQPVVVRSRADGGYELIAGERRWRAAREAGLATVPALIREADDRETLLLGLVENVARKDLSPVEEARAYAVLLDEFGLSLGEVAERVGRSKPAVSNRMRLLELPDDILELVESDQLSEGHARAVLAVGDHEARRRLARRIMREGLSVRAAERAARAGGARTKRRRSRPADPALSARVEAAGERVLGVPVRVRAGKVEVPFDDDVELADLAEAFEWADRALSTPRVSREPPTS
jgi:ParB family transcriptional regulator, chromosome partitioning protein